MKETVRDKLALFKRTLPLISPGNARFMHARPEDLRRKGTHVVVWVVLWSSDGRVSIHKTSFSHKPALAVGDWASMLVDRAPYVFREFVIPALNEQTGVAWALDRVVGWHFVRGRAGK